MMSFDQSTQCKSWLFSEKDLKLCREEAAGEQFVARKQNGEARVRKYASGFKPTAIESVHSPRSVQLVDDFIPPPTSLSSDEQEILVRFHAHQISMLVGPDAILPSLIRSETVFSTSIMIFRRFYLSNSVLDFSPRIMAVASCFLASKLEENRIEVSSRPCGIGDTSTLKIASRFVFFWVRWLPGWRVCYLFMLTRSLNGIDTVICISLSNSAQRIEFLDDFILKLDVKSCGLLLQRWCTRII
jgi:hypothetical protein